MCIPGVHRSHEKAIGPLLTGSTQGWEPRCGCWDQGFSYNSDVRITPPARKPTSNRYQDQSQGPSQYPDLLSHRA